MPDQEIGLAWNGGHYDYGYESVCNVRLASFLLSYAIYVILMVSPAKEGAWAITLLSALVVPKPIAGTRLRSPRKEPDLSWTLPGGYPFVHTSLIARFRTRIDMNGLGSLILPNVRKGDALGSASLNS